MVWKKTHIFCGTSDLVLSVHVLVTVVHAHQQYLESFLVTLATAPVNDQTMIRQLLAEVIVLHILCTGCASVGQCVVVLSRLPLILVAHNMLLHNSLQPSVMWFDDHRTTIHPEESIKILFSPPKAVEAISN
eukprot:evm.model.scf_648.5 EVM.evm.TU.scf_648.5   scf_648:37952-38347(-)